MEWPGVISLHKVLGRRRAVGAVEIKGAVAIERWRYCWLSLTMICFSLVSNNWHEAISLA
jgi:hypothetical protein